MRNSKPVKVDYRLDLHGFTVEQAHSRCVAKFQELLANNGRIIEVITGKSGQIRQEFPHWLEIWGYTARKSSNDGSFIVTLGKKSRH